MGLYQALSSFHNSSGNVLPPGFKKAGRFVWIARIQTDGQKAISASIQKQEDFPHPIPKSPSDRTSGKISPSLLIDKASYALGVCNNISNRRKSKDENSEFIRFLKDAKSLIANDPDISDETKFTISAAAELNDEILDSLKITNGIKESDMVIFLVDSLPYAFSDADLVAWNNNYHAKRLASGDKKYFCPICGNLSGAARLSPKITLFKERPPLSSFNIKSSESHGKKQMLNAPVCNECAGAAESILGTLIQLDDNTRSGPHCVVLVQDTKGKRPLTNQMAIFWSKDEITAQPNDNTPLGIASLTQAVRISLDDDEEEESPDNQEILPTARSGQLRNFLESPWYCKGREVETFNPIPFYFAILSPNKSRLAIREWIETDVSSVRGKLCVYRNALEIIDPATGKTIIPALRTVLEALRAPAVREKKNDEKSRLAEIEPELTRQLVRTMYVGDNPPDALFRRALQAFSLPDSAEGVSAKRLSQRRTALAAAIKLVLTYLNQNHAKAMTQLETKHDESCAYKKQSPYLCGRVFAILSEIQKRASSSGHGVNATVVDKFYSAVASAPQSVLGSLLTKASVGHLPKLRKDPAKAFTKAKNQGGIPLSDLLTETVALLDAANGPERQHSPRQQAEFALGYHHQLAELTIKPKA